MICKKCNAPNNDNSSFCEYCGASLNESQNTNDNNNGSHQPPANPNNNIQTQSGPNTNYTQQPYQNNYFQQQNPNNNTPQPQGTLTIIREKKFTGSLIDFYMIINKQRLHTLASGRSLQYKLPFGTHQITIDALSDETTQIITLTPDKPNVTIYVTAGWGALAAKPKITNIQYC